jgi:hypothetical protein
MSKKPLEIIGHHECEILERYNGNPKHAGHNIDIQKLSDGNWYWVKYGDTRGNAADGIKICPYCGEVLVKEEVQEDTAAVEDYNAPYIFFVKEMTELNTVIDSLVTTDEDFMISEFTRLDDACLRYLSIWRGNKQIVKDLQFHDDLNEMAFICGELQLDLLKEDFCNGEMFSCICFKMMRKKKTPEGK